MNIGIVTTWFERGAAYVSRQYKDVLEKDGHQVFIYARGGEADAVANSRWGGPEVKNGKSVCFPLPTYIDERDFKAWLIDNHIETVFFNEQRWLKPVLLCRDLGVKTGSYVDYYTEDTVRSFDVYDFLICNTKRHYSAFSWHEQASYIPWGTDVDLFDTSSFREHSEKVRFFTSAGMNPYRKGTDLAINSFSLAALDPDFQRQAELVVHTQRPLRAFFQSLEGQTKTLDNFDGLIRSGSLRVIERTVGAPGLYHEGDVYVYPSRLDGIGLTVAEALACGMPIVVPDDAPMNEFMPPQGSSIVKIERFFCRSDAYYWPQNEVSLESFAAVFQKYVKEKSRLKEYGAAARKYAVDNLNWINNKKEIVDAFVLTRKRSLSPGVAEKAAGAFANQYPKIVKYEHVYRVAYSFVSKLRRR